MQPIFWKMIDILDHFAPCSCRDPRDKVFGLMVFVSESEAMKIDYMLTAEELFTLVVEKVSDYAPEVVISFARRLRISMGLGVTGSIRDDQGIWQHKFDCEFSCSARLRNGITSEQGGHT